MAGAQRGFLLITAVVLIVVVALLLTVTVYFSATGSQAAVGHLSSKQALFVADTGLERSIRALEAPVLTERLYCNAVTGNVNLTNVAFGDGRFTVTGGASLYSNTAVTLNGNVNATVTVIPLNGAYPVPGYATSGRVMIDREKIDYSEISNDAAECGTAPCLLGVQRGVDGTAAAAHASGARIGQYQCALISAGGVPDFGAPRGDRVITAGIQLQEAWAVGENGVILRWDGVNWAVFATTGTRLRAVSMDSYANGWTVGDLTGNVAHIRRWNPDGTPAWDAVAYPNVPNDQRLNSVHVLSANEAWAVGNDRGGGGNNTMILRFNGANWVYSDPGIDRDLNGVYMLDTNNDGVADDGWAVGERQGNNFAFMRWNGAAWNQVMLNSGDREDLNGVFMLSNTDGWAVGEERNGRFTIVRWNNPGAGVWNPWSFANANSEDLNGIYMLSGADGWAVGDNGVILRWNGATWNVSVAPNALTGNNLLAVTCATSSDCWAVGVGGVIAHWNGVAWSLHPQSGVVTGNDLHGVHITAARRDPQAAWREIYQ
jgi:type II secretory pathway pseudopilin PulG